MHNVQVRELESWTAEYSAHPFTAAQRLDLGMCIGTVGSVICSLRRVRPVSLRGIGHIDVR